MNVDTQLKVVQVKRAVQPLHEVGQLKQDMNAPSTSWEERISTSGNASAVKRGMQAAMRAPEVRTQRIEELRAQIAGQDGSTYEIDSIALAQKMLNISNSF